LSSDEWFLKGPIRLKVLPVFIQLLVRRLCPITAN